MNMNMKLMTMNKFMNMNHMTINGYEQYEPNFIGCMTFHKYGLFVLFYILEKIHVTVTLFFSQLFFRG